MLSGALGNFIQCIRHTFSDVCKNFIESLENSLTAISLPPHRPRRPESIAQFLNICIPLLLPPLSNGINNGDRWNDRSDYRSAPENLSIIRGKKKKKTKIETARACVCACVSACEITARTLLKPTRRKLD